MSAIEFIVPLMAMFITLIFIVYFVWKREIFYINLEKSYKELYARSDAMSIEINVLKTLVSGKIK